MDYNRIAFKTLMTPYTGIVTEVLYAMEKELKAGNAIRFVCSAKDRSVSADIIRRRQEKTVTEYMERMMYLYGKELQTVTNEDDLQEYYILAYRNSIYPRRYQISWDTLEGGRYHHHEHNGLLTAQNVKHARDRFRIWWDAKEYSRKPHPRHAFHVTVIPE